MACLITLTIFIAGCGMPAVRNPIDPDIDSLGETANEDIGSLTIVFIDVGQGAATLVTSAERDAVLIDAGHKGGGLASVLPAIRRHGISKLRAIIATHYHADHIGGIGEVLLGEDGIAGTPDDVTVTDGIFDRGGSYEGESPEWNEYRAYSEGRRSTLSPGDDVDLGETAIHVVAANGMLADGTQIPIEPFDENSASIGLMIEYGSFRMFIGGDITGGGGNPPYQTVDIETPLAPLVGDVDVLAVSHHGSMTSTNQAFLDTLRPESAVISCGDFNEFFHPHKSVLDRLINTGTHIYQTEKCWSEDNINITATHGDIELTTDGAAPPNISIISS